MKSYLVLAGLAVASISNAAFADPIVDGQYDAAYGAAKSSVTYVPGAPNSNFAAPTPFSDTASYDIFLTAGASSVYGYLHADRVTGLQFANLYFDLDPANNNGSDLGFEIGANGVNAFVPGVAGSVALSGISTAFSADGLGIEFALSNSLFTTPIAGLTYYDGQQFPTNGSAVTLRLSQSFGYSVAGGASYGADRLGSVTLGAAAVPEPATWAMLLVGFGMIGGSMRYRRRSTQAIYA